MNHDPQGNNVEKIREVLFGRQMQDYERRLSRLETRIDRAVDGLRDEIISRLDGLESFVRSETRSIGEGLKVEQQQRSESADDLQKTLKTLERRIAELNARAAQAEKELRDQLLEVARGVRADISRSSEMLSTRLEQAVLDLEQEKVDRSTLAMLLSEVALRLHDQLDVADLVSPT